MLDEKTIEKMFEEWFKDKYDEAMQARDWQQCDFLAEDKCIMRIGFEAAINLLPPIIQKQDEQLKWCKSNVGYVRINKTQQEVSEMIKRLGGEG